MNKKEWAAYSKEVDERIRQYAKEKRKTSIALLREDEMIGLAAVVYREVREECAQIVDKYAKANAESDIMAAAFAQCADEVRRT